jgi:hypothetical protein
MGYSAKILSIFAFMAANKQAEIDAKRLGSDLERLGVEITDCIVSNAFQLRDCTIKEFLGTSQVMAARAATDKPLGLDEFNRVFKRTVAIQFNQKEFLGDQAELDILSHRIERIKIQWLQAARAVFRHIDYLETLLRTVSAVMPSKIASIKKQLAQDKREIKRIMSLPRDFSLIDQKQHRQLIRRGEFFRAFLSFRQIYAKNQMDRHMLKELKAHMAALEKLLASAENVEANLKDSKPSFRPFIKTLTVEIDWIVHLTTASDYHPDEISKMSSKLEELGALKDQYRSDAASILVMIPAVANFFNISLPTHWDTDLNQVPAMKILQIQLLHTLGQRATLISKNSRAKETPKIDDGDSHPHALEKKGSATQGHIDSESKAPMHQDGLVLEATSGILSETDDAEQETWGDDDDVAEGKEKRNRRLKRRHRKSTHASGCRGEASSSSILTTPKRYRTKMLGMVETVLKDLGDTNSAVIRFRELKSVLELYGPALDAAGRKYFNNFSKLSHNAGDIFHCHLGRDNVVLWGPSPSDPLEVEIFALTTSHPISSYKPEIDARSASVRARSN